MSLCTLFTRASRGPAGVMLARRERGRTALQAAERSAKRAKEEKVLRDEEARLVLMEAQKVEPLLLVSPCRFRGLVLL